VVFLFENVGAYVIASRRTHRAITWRLAKYAHARVLGFIIIDYKLLIIGYRLKKRFRFQ
jgi:hypothetical protein